MPIIARDNSVPLNPAPEGLYQAVCVDVVDLGQVKTPWGLQNKVQIRWMLNIKDPKTERNYMVLRQFKLSLHKEAGLSKILESWRGRKFTKEERAGFDVEKLIGANCQIQVVHNVTDEAVYANVQTIVPINSTMVKMQVGDEYIRVKDRDGTKPEANGSTPVDEDLPF